MIYLPLVFHVIYRITLSLPYHRPVVNETNRAGHLTAILAHHVPGTDALRAKRSGEARSPATAGRRKSAVGNGDW